MWQVYLFLANERQVHDRQEADDRRLPAGSRIRRWRDGRRTAGVQARRHQGKLTGIHRSLV